MHQILQNPRPNPTINISIFFAAKFLPNLSIVQLLTCVTHSKSQIHFLRKNLICLSTEPMRLRTNDAYDIRSLGSSGGGSDAKGSGDGVVGGHASVLEADRDDLDCRSVGGDSVGEAVPSASAIAISRGYGT